MAFEVETELSLQIGTLGPLVLRSTGVVTVNGSGGGGHLTALAIPAGLIDDTVAIDVTDPGAAPIKGVKFHVANGAGAITETPGGALQGAVPLPGYTKVCLFGSNCASAEANLTVPFTVVGSQGTGNFEAAVSITVSGAPWTTQQAAIGTVTRVGFAHGPASAPSSTARVGGVLQLVTPIFVSTNIPPSAGVPVFAMWTIRFVPEPTTLALLGLGICGLAAAGGRRKLPD